MNFLNPTDIQKLDAAEFEEISRRACIYVPVSESIGLIRILSRFKMYVDNRDVSLAPHLITDGFWETWLTKAIASHVKVGDYCIDVGANVGYYAILMSILSEDHNRVVAIEPNPTIYKLLNRTSKLNHPGFLAVEAAVGNSTKEIVLQIPEEHWGDASLISDRKDKHAKVTSVNVHQITIDSLVERIGFEKVDVIKIDAEGYEPQIWKGMANTISQNLGLRIFMEFSPQLYENPEGFLQEISQTQEVYIIHYDSSFQLVLEEDFTMLINRDRHLDLLLLNKHRNREVKSEVSL